MPLAGHGLRPPPLRRRASRPQLKRDPLGLNAVNNHISWRKATLLFFAPLSIIGATLVAWLCFWAILLLFDRIIHISDWTYLAFWGALALVAGVLGTNFQLHLEHTSRPSLVDHLRHAWPFYVVAVLYGPVVWRCTPDTCDFFFALVAIPLAAAIVILANGGAILWRRIHAVSDERVEA